MAADAGIPKIARALRGVRILQQDPWECLIVFLCSSNNNTPRIARTMDGGLRGMGFGYQAKYIIETWDLLVEFWGDDYLLNLCTL